MSALPTTVRRVGDILQINPPLRRVYTSATGAVHKVRHAIFGQFLPPLPLSHFVTHPGTPRKYVTHLGTPRFLENLVQKTWTKAPLYKFCLNCSQGFLSEVLSGGLLSGRFCPGWFLSVPVLSEYICYIRKLNIILNFMFRRYDKKIYKCDVTCSLPPPLCHKLSHLLGPPPPSSVTYFMD